MFDEEFEDDIDYEKHEEDYSAEILEEVIEKGEKARYSKNWTEPLIQRVLTEQYRKRHQYTIHNKYFFEPYKCKQWESDSLSFGKNKMIYEWEIKKTIHDATREKDKKKDKHEFLQLVFDSQGEALLNPRYNPDRAKSKKFKYSCPNYFYFVCQEGLISPEYVKENYDYAGLKWITDKGKIKTKVRKKIHSYKLDWQDRLLNKCYWGLQNLEARSWEVKKNFRKLSDKELQDPKFMRSFVTNSLKKLKV